MKDPLRVVWISDFPVEWLPDVPEPLRGLPRQHPATWQMVLLSEFEKNPSLQLHVILFRRRIANDVHFERHGVTFHVLKAAAWARLGSLFWTDTVRIRRICQHLKPDVVHAWGSEKGAAVIASRLPYPNVVTIQGLFAWYKELVPLPPYFWFVEQLERVSLPRARVVTTESAFAVRYLKKRFPGLIVHQAEHAPNRSFFEVSRQPQTRPVQFIAVGGLGFRKGTDLLVRALEHLETPFELTLVTGPDIGYLKELRPPATPELWSRIHLKQHILPDQVAQALIDPTLMLLPTRADVSPNAVKEAVVAGVPVVASEIGGVPDYVQPGLNGLLFEAGNQERFTAAIQEAIRHPLFGLGKVDAASLERNREYLSPERMAQNFLKAYELALNAGNRPASATVGAMPGN